MSKENKRHPVRVVGFNGTNVDLGRAIARLRYDQIVEVLKGFREETLIQAEGDKRRGRIRLHEYLSGTDIFLEILICRFERIFQVCKAHMKNELEISGD